MSKPIEVTQFTIEANNISEENKQDIISLLQDLMENYNDIAFEPLTDCSLVHTETMNYEG